MAANCPMNGSGMPRSGKGDGGKGKGKTGKEGKTGKSDKDGKVKTGKDGKTGKSDKDGKGKDGEGKTGKDGKSGKDAKGKGGRGNIPAGPVTADMLTSKKGVPLTVGELANKFAQLAKAKNAPAVPPPGADDGTAQQQQCLTTPPATHPLTQLNSTLTSASLRGRAAGKGAAVGGGGVRSPSIVSNTSEKSVPGANYVCHACGQQGRPGGHFVSRCPQVLKKQAEQKP